MSFVINDPNFIRWLLSQQFQEQQVASGGDASQVAMNTAELRTAALDVIQTQYIRMRAFMYCTKTPLSPSPSAVTPFEKALVAFFKMDSPNASDWEGDFAKARRILEHQLKKENALSEVKIEVSVASVVGGRAPPAPGLAALGLEASPAIGEDQVKKEIVSDDEEEVWWSSGGCAPSALGPVLEIEDPLTFEVKTEEPSSPPSMD